MSILTTKSGLYVPSRFQSDGLPERIPGGWGGLAGTSPLVRGSAYMLGGSVDGPLTRNLPKLFSYQMPRWGGISGFGGFRGGTGPMAGFQPAGFQNSGSQSTSPWGGAPLFPFSGDMWPGFFGAQQMAQTAPSQRGSAQTPVVSAQAPATPAPAPEPGTVSVPESETVSPSTSAATLSSRKDDTETPRGSSAPKPAPPSRAPQTKRERHTEAAPKPAKEPATSPAPPSPSPSLPTAKATPSTPVEQTKAIIKHFENGPVGRIIDNVPGRTTPIDLPEPPAPTTAPSPTPPPSAPVHASPTKAPPPPPKPAAPAASSPKPPAPATVPAVPAAPTTGAPKKESPVDPKRTGEMADRLGKIVGKPAPLSQTDSPQKAAPKKPDKPKTEKPSRSASIGSKPGTSEKAAQKPKVVTGAPKPDKKPEPAQPEKKLEPAKRGDPDRQVTADLMNENRTLAEELLIRVDEITFPGFPVSWQFGPAKPLVEAKIAQVKAKHGLRPDEEVPAEKAQLVADELFTFAQMARPARWPQNAADALKLLSDSSKTGLGLNFPGIQNSTPELPSKETGKIADMIDQSIETPQPKKHGECSEQTAVFLALNAAAQNKYVMGAEVFRTRVDEFGNVQKKASPIFHICAVLRLPGKTDTIYDPGMKKTFSASKNIHQYATLSHREFAALQAANAAKVLDRQKKPAEAKKLLEAAAKIAPERSFIPYMQSWLADTKVKSRAGDTERSLFGRYEKRVREKLGHIDKGLALTGVEGLAGQPLLTEETMKSSNDIGTKFERNRELLALKVMTLREVVQSAQLRGPRDRQQFWENELQAALSIVNIPQI